MPPNDSRRAIPYWKATKQLPTCLAMSVGISMAVALSGVFSSALAQSQPSILVQSTTSTANSGLYDYLLPKFTDATGIHVNVVAVGTGQAIKNAQNCDADVLLVHAKAAEDSFVAAGYGVQRYDVMYNDFVIVGPAADPAKLTTSTSVIDALTRIAESGALFASRGDDSGTHKKEQQLWQTATIDLASASGSWYRETGSGMGATLNTAVGMSAYTLTDRATWISFGNKADFEILVAGDESLHNQYGVIQVSPTHCPDVNVQDSQSFIKWLRSSAGQSLIEDYRIDGQQLFFPNAMGES